MLEWILAILILIGAFFTLVGSIGLYKLSDFYMRLHGPTKASTLGVGAILIASAIHFSFKTEGVAFPIYHCPGKRTSDGKSRHSYQS